MYFVVATLVSLIDPIVIVAFVVAALLARDGWRAAGFGLVAGVAVAVLSLLLAQKTGRAPHPASLAAQVTACVIGAVLMRTAINAVRKSRDVAA